MEDLFDQKILCNTCDIKTNIKSLIKDGFQIRVLECPKCNKVIYHPGDMKEYEDYNKLLKKQFDVKLRMIGNSFCISIPREIIEFHREFEKEFNNLVRLNMEEPGKIGLFFRYKK